MTFYDVIDNAIKWVLTASPVFLTSVFFKARNKIDITFIGRNSTAHLRNREKIGQVHSKASHVSIGHA